MERLKEGQYFGSSNSKWSLNGITVTDTKYTHDYVDWHCHENPYFTFLLQGKLIEKNKKETYCMSQGNLLFHNWQDAHCNVKPPEFTRGAHLEITREWMERFEIDLGSIEGSIKVINPRIKNLLFNVLIESKIDDSYNHTSIELLVMDILANLDKDLEGRNRKRPSWFKKLEALIYGNPDAKLTLEQVSRELGVHPVHLSRTFHKYYGMTFGSYCREVRLNRAVWAIKSKEYTMADVAYLNNYSDQSHMIASFKEKFNLTPRQFAKIIG